MELSPGERALIDEARAGEAPSDQVRQRVRASVFAQLGIATAGAAAATTAAKNAAASATAKGTAAAGSGLATAEGAAASTGLATVNGAAAGTGLATVNGASVGTGLAATKGTAIATSLTAAKGAASAGTGLATIKGAVLGTGLLGKVVLASSIAAVGAGIAVSTSEPSTPPAPAPTVAATRQLPVPSATSPPEPAAVQDDALDEERAPLEEETGDSALTSAAPEPPSCVAKPPQAAPTAAPSRLGAELALLREAQEKLQSGNGEEAFALLDEHEDEFPEGGLSEERQAARVFALCQMGKHQEARAEAARFLRNAPHSPLADRVRNACGGPSGLSGEDRPE